MKIIDATMVQYYGIDISITMPFLAVDETGALFEYENQPEILENEQWWNPRGGASNYICKVDLEGVDWKETLAWVKL